LIWRSGWTIQIGHFWLKIKNRAQSTQRLCALQSTIVGLLTLIYLDDMLIVNYLWCMCVMHVWYTNVNYLWCRCVMHMLIICDACVMYIYININYLWCMYDVNFYYLWCRCVIYMLIVCDICVMYMLIVCNACVMHMLIMMYVWC
jgi:hypothetical protein